MSKTDIRSSLSRILKNLSPDRIKLKSGAVASSLFRLPEWRSSGAVLVFLSLTQEVDTGPLIDRALAEKKRVFAPRVNGDDLVFHALRSRTDGLVRHPYGMLEPAAHFPVFPAGLGPGTKVLVLVPGIAFDERKNRLGRGRGFYDRALRALKTGWSGGALFLLGLCFEEQLLPVVPCDGHDAAVDAVLTDRRLVR